MMDLDWEDSQSLSDMVIAETEEQIFDFSPRKITVAAEDSLEGRSGAAVKEQNLRRRRRSIYHRGCLHPDPMVKRVAAEDSVEARSGASKNENKSRLRELVVCRRCRRCIPPSPVDGEFQNLLYSEIWGKMVLPHWDDEDADELWETERSMLKILVPSLFWVRFF